MLAAIIKCCALSKLVNIHSLWQPSIKSFMTCYGSAAAAQQLLTTAEAAHGICPSFAVASVLPATVGHNLLMTATVPDYIQRA
jgi:hypothetical protein